MITVKYKVTESTRKLRWDAKKPDDLLVESVLSLENQPGSPIPFWGSAPAKMRLPGVELPLGDIYVMTVEKEQTP